MSTVQESDKVDHPVHYNKGRYEVIDVIDDWGLGFNTGNVIKYIARAPHKENIVEDYEKAIWYLEREINKIKREREEVI